MIIENLRQALDLVEKISTIPSGTLNPTGVNAVQQRLALHFEKLKFESRWHAAVDPQIPVADLLEMSLPGTSSEWVTFVSHADTLDHGVEVAEKIEVRRESEHLVAPGILDDKASQIVGLWAIVQFLAKHPRPKRGLRFVSSPNEELGSTGFQQYYEKLSEVSSLALGLEPAFRGRDIVKERRGNRWYDVEVVGVEAHSGRDPEKGLSALHDLCIKGAALNRINKHRAGLSLNIGEITSDNPTYNLVAGRATAKIDLRFMDQKMRDRSHRKVDKILMKPALPRLSSKQCTRTSYKIVDDCPPLKANRESSRAAAAMVQILRNVEGNSQITAVRSGGAADVSYMARKGLVVLDGLGACGGNMHRKDEFVIISSIETRAKALAQFLEFIETT